MKTDREAHDFMQALIDDCSREVALRKTTEADRDSLKAKVEALEAALKPFAEAAEDTDAKDADQRDIWEHPAALNITVGDLRRALSARLLNKEDRNG